MVVHEPGSEEVHGHGLPEAGGGGKGGQVEGVAGLASRADGGQPGLGSILGERHGGTSNSISSFDVSGVEGTDSTGPY